MARNPRSYGKGGNNPLTNRTAGTPGTGVTGSTPAYTGRVRSDLRALADSQAISQPQASGLGAGWLDVQAKVNQLQNSKAQIMAQGAAVLAEQAGSLPMRLTLAQRNIWESKNLASMISRAEDKHLINRDAAISEAGAENVANLIKMRAGQVAMAGDIGSAMGLADLASALTKLDQAQSDVKSGMGRTRSVAEETELKGKTAINLAKTKKYAVKGVDGKYLVDENGQTLYLTESEWRARASAQLSSLSGEKDIQAIRKSILENNLLGYTDNYAKNLDQHVSERVDAFLKDMNAKANMSEVQFNSFEERFRTLQKSEELKRIGLGLVNEAYSIDPDTDLLVVDETLIELGLRFLDQTGQYSTTSLTLGKSYQTLGVEAIRDAQEIWDDYKNHEITKDELDRKMAQIQTEIAQTQSATRPDVQRFFGMMNMAGQMITNPDALGISWLSEDIDERTDQVMAMLQIMSGMQVIDPELKGKQKPTPDPFTLTGHSLGIGGTDGNPIPTKAFDMWTRSGGPALRNRLKKGETLADLYERETKENPYSTREWGPGDKAKRLLGTWVRFLDDPTDADKVGILMRQHFSDPATHEAFMGHENIDQYLNNFIETKIVKSTREDGGRQTSQEEKTVLKEKLEAKATPILRLDTDGKVKAFTSSEDKFKEAVKEKADNAWKSRPGHSIGKDGKLQRVGTTGDSPESLITEYDTIKTNFEIDLKEEWKRDGHWDVVADKPQLIGEKHTSRDSAFINEVMRLILSQKDIPGDYLNAHHVADDRLHKEFTKLIKGRLSTAAHTFGYNLKSENDVKRLNWLMGQSALLTLRLAQEEDSNVRWSSFFTQTGEPMGIRFIARDPYGKDRSEEHGGANTLASAHLYAMLGMDNAPIKKGTKKNIASATSLGFHKSNPASDSVTTAINNFNVRKNAGRLW